MTQYNWSIVQAVRRNHALEHATLHVLQEMDPNLRLAGRSDLSGFWVYGKVETAALAAAAEQALRRLTQGESHLAVHPRCGTNLVAGMVLAGLASQAALLNEKRPAWRRAAYWILGMGAALILTQPVGTQIQANLTTTSDVRGLRIAGVQPQPHAQRPIHHVQTSWN
jgi:hypothetical protein